MSSVVSLVNNSIDMRARVSTPSQYTWRKIQPESPATVDLNSSTQIQFKIPSGLCVNLSKSILRFTRTTTAVNHTFLYNGCLPISGLDVTTQRGVLLSTNQRLRHWSKLSVGLLKDSRKWMNNNSYVFAGEASDGLDRADVDAGNTVGRQFLNDGSFSGAGMNLFNVASHDYFAAGGANRAYAVPGESVYGTILSHPSNMYFSGESVTLTFTLPATLEIGFTAADADGATPAALAAAGGISGVEYLLAIETNSDICQSLINTVNSQGLEIPYNAVIEYSDLTDNSTAYSRQYQLDLSRGSACQLVVAGLAVSNEVLKTRLNFNNIAAAKWSSVRCFANQKPLSDYPLTREELYLQARESVMEYSIVPVRTMFDAYGFVPFDFTGMAAADYIKESKLVSGLDLTNPVTLQIDWVKTAAIYRAFVFAVVTRKLILQPLSLGGGVAVRNV